MTFKNLLLITMLAVFAVAVTGCNTVHGVGKDVEKAGEVIQEGADEAH